MPTVELTFSPLPAHVRTARLVAAAVARRAGLAEDVVDEVKLAVGEACARAVGLHRERSPDEPVRVAIADGDLFEVVVVDRGPGADGAPDLAGWPFTADLALPPDIGLAVITGLVDDVEVTDAGPGTRVRMRWPRTGAPSL